MDLTARLRRWALACPRVLVVDPPGSRALRWGVEESLARRGWEHALSPAATDLLLVLGSPGPELASAIDVLWSQVPEPRLRIAVPHDDDVEAALDAAQAALRLPSEPGDRPTPEDLLGTEEEEEGSDDDGGMDDGGMDHGGMDDGGMDHGGMDHGAMDHGAMEIAGLPMAGTGEDRDGLALDVLPVGLGPVLPGWPTGLVLRAEAHGDVLVGPALSWLDDGPLPRPEPEADPRRLALDHLAAFLDVAGWGRAARAARRARDGIASDDPARAAAAERDAGKVASRVRRSRLLAWAAGRDVMTDVAHWCDAAAGRSAAPPDAGLERLAARLDGMEIGRARLVLAAVAPSRVGAPVGAAHA